MVGAQKSLKKLNFMHFLVKKDNHPIYSRFSEEFVYLKQPVQAKTHRHKQPVQAKAHRLHDK